VKWDVCIGVRYGMGVVVISVMGRWALRSLAKARKRIFLNEVMSFNKILRFFLSSSNHNPSIFLVTCDLKLEWKRHWLERRKKIVVKKEEKNPIA